MLGHEGGFDNPGSHHLTMSLFKRIEVWILLLLAAGSGLFVIWQDRHAGDRKEPLTDQRPAGDSTRLTVLECALERDFGNARLDLRVRLTNRQSRRLLLTPPAVRLMDGAGSDIPAFILPVEKPPELAPQTEATAMLRFWLEKSHLQGPLTLEVNGERATVKGPVPLDLEKIENAKSRKFPPGQDWKP